MCLRVRYVKEDTAACICIGYALRQKGCDYFMQAGCARSFLGRAE